jgi:hypothetical protein
MPNRNLSANVVKGIFGGPRGIKGGDYLRANITKSSGGGIITHASSVNGNIDTVRKPVKNGKMKK